MNKDQAAGNWKQVKGKIKEQWGKLTDDEIDQLQGKSEQLAGKLQERYGLAQDEAEKAAPMACIKSLERPGVATAIREHELFIRGIHPT